MKEKYLFSFLLFTCCAIKLFSQSPNWSWAKRAGGTSSDGGYSTTTDASGNVFVVGGFNSSTIAFGSATLTNIGGSDMYIAKYDNSGNILWAKSGGGSTNDWANSVATDTSGNIYVAGYFASPTITFDTTTLTNAGSGNIFIVKYDPSGIVLWAKSAGGTNYSDEAVSVTTDANSNSYVTGYFNSPSITFGTTTLTNTGNTDMFIVKYNFSGNAIWAKKAGSIGSDGAHSVTADNLGNIYVVGGFTSPSIVFATATLTNVVTTGVSPDIFLVKYDTSGNELWAKRAGGNDFDNGQSVSSDDSGNVYVVGGFNSYSIIFGTTTLTNISSYDMFIAKYDNGGNALWAKSAGGTGGLNTYEGAYSVVVNASGVYVTGGFLSGTLNFTSATVTNVSPGTNDIFLVKYNSSGNTLWAKRAGGTGNDDGSSVTSDPSGYIYVAGFFDSGNVIFGSSTLTNAFPSAGNYDMFIAKLDKSTTSGIETFSNQNNFILYPNPTNGNFTIQSPERFSILEITNFLGEKVYETISMKGANNNTLQSGKQIIDLSTQPDGIYFLQLETIQGNISKKIIIAR